jgi:hypothetical protein
VIRAILQNDTMLKLSLILALTSSFAFAADVPSISADLGPCSARFTVTDGAKPIYDAKVRTRIKYGSFGIRKIDLEIGTDANGKADVLKLPNLSKQPIVFEVVKGDISRTVIFDPSQQCEATYDVALRKPTTPQPPQNPQP